MILRSNQLKSQPLCHLEKEGQGLHLAAPGGSPCLWELSFPHNEVGKAPKNYLTFGAGAGDPAVSTADPKGQTQPQPQEPRQVTGGPGAQAAFVLCYHCPFGGCGGHLSALVWCLKQSGHAQSLQGQDSRREPWSPHTLPWCPGV